MASESMPQLSAVGDFILGGLADTVAVVFTQPLDYLKTRIQNGEKAQLKLEFLSFKNGIPPVHHFWRGTIPNCTGAIPNGALPFLVNSLTRRYLFGTDELTGGQQIANGLLTGAIISVFISPLDRVCKEQQLEKKVQLSTIEAGRRAFAKEGIKGFFKAVPSLATRDAITFGTFFGVRKVVESRLTEEIAHAGMRAMIASVLTGVMAGLLSNPADLANTSIQGDQVGKYTRFIPTLRTIAKEEGKKALFRGALARAIFMGAYSTALGYSADAIRPHLPECFMMSKS